jgi:hypothetical protein
MPKRPKPKTANVIALLKSVIGDMVELEGKLTWELSKHGNEISHIRGNLWRAVKMLYEEIQAPKGRP